MTRARLALALFALLPGVIACGGDETEEAAPTTTEVAVPLRLMALGDSITAGPFYRAPLQRLLAADGCQVDFVGSAVDEQPAQAGLTDLDNEGHGGWRADQLGANARAWVGAAEPDVVLLYAGVNDLYAGEDVATVTADLGHLVDEVRAAAPEAQVLVARIMPAAGIEAQVAEYDAAIAELVGEQVDVVDLESGFDHATDTVDGVHPNEAASERMAQAWFEALVPHLDGVCRG